MKECVCYELPKPAMQNSVHIQGEKAIKQLFETERKQGLDEKHCDAGINKYFNPFGEPTYLKHSIV
jgi:hypothetical protein